MISAEEPRRGATISADGRYRYHLWRTIAAPADGLKALRGTVTFIMLNPSTADADVDDPTIRRCMGYAWAWACARVEVVNLYAWRATRPCDLRAAIRDGGHDIAIGPENTTHLRAACLERDTVTVAAWGANAPPPHAHATVRMLERVGVHVHRIDAKLTGNGQPRHPLYLRGDARLVRWSP